ncbi:hypothetical protein KSD_71080 [Ktedonobacter sp. SOSP1-85]|nr:hypothetical protein KSD_70330 [Ktedonobacter sp. SOSP1-85]GHO79337.1 hypothetical protein KSD_71080 [Ktedonobacter sp. SOSP1-85]
MYLCSQCCIITTMKRHREEQTTIKMWVKTHDSLRLLAALQKKSMVEVLDRLVGEALKKEQVKPHGSQDL